MATTSSAYRHFLDTAAVGQDVLTYASKYGISEACAIIDRTDDQLVVSGRSDSIERYSLQTGQGVGAGMASMSILPIELAERIRGEDEIIEQRDVPAYVDAALQG